MSVQDLLNYQAIRGSGYDSSGFSSNQNGNLFEKLAYMIAFTNAQALMNPKMISAVLNGPHTINDAGSIASATRTANSAYFFPIYVPKQIALTRLYWENGATVSGNVDIGIYDDAGTRLVSTGSTAQAGTSSIQRVTISLTLDPGFYWLAVAIDNGTGTFRQVGTQQLAHNGGSFLASSNFPLPSTLPTPTTNNVGNTILCGGAVDASWPSTID